MATAGTTSVKSMKVSLKAGVAQATLPNNISMKPSVTYAISLEDYAKITNAARTSIIDSTPETKEYVVPWSDGTNQALDLSVASGTAKSMNNATAWDTVTNFTTLDELVVDDGVLYRHLSAADSTNQKPAQNPSLWQPLAKVGQVVQGFNNAAFKLVKVDSGSATVAQGSAVIWNGTSVTSDNSDVATPVFAGVSIGTITAGKYGWIQVAGEAISVKAETNVAAGDAVSVSDNTDELVTSSTNEVVRLDLVDWATGDSTKFTYATVESSAVAFDDVDALGTALLRAALIKTTLETIPALTGNISVVEATENLIYDVTFINGLAATNVGAITFTSPGGTWGPGTATVTTVGSGGISGVIGTATSYSSGRADVDLRATTSVNRHNKTRDLFFWK